MVTRTVIVICRSHRIETTVTSTPSVVRRWLFKIKYFHRHKLWSCRFTAGVGVQWRPNHRAGMNSPPAAVLQICVGRRCLVFQLIHSQRVPLILRRFLVDPDVFCVGIQNRSDKAKLRRSRHRIQVDRLLDLCSIANDELNCGILSTDRLVERVLGWEGMETKPEWVGRSDWDQHYLSDEQVKYACWDAFLSFKIGMELKVWDHDQDQYS